MDLSKLLDDLYEADGSATGAGDPAAVEVARSSDGTAGDQYQETAMGFHTGAAPEWSDEARLDEVFAFWTPGPPSDAPAAEREMAYAGGPGLAAPAAPSDMDLDASFPEAFPELSADQIGAELPSEHGRSEPELEAGEARPWSRSDDDVLPHSRRRAGRRLSLRRR